MPKEVESGASKARCECGAAASRTTLCRRPRLRGLASFSIEGIAEKDASPLRRGRLQSVVRDAAAPHSQRALLAPDSTSLGMFRGVYSVRLNRAAGDLSMAVLKEDSAAASDYSNSSTVDDVSGDRGLLNSHPGISAAQSGAEQFQNARAAAVANHNTLTTAAY